jgi:hypothetical protein
VAGIQSAPRRAAPLEAAAGKLQVRLVDESGGRQRARRNFAVELPAGDAAQLLVDERKQPIQGVRLTFADAAKELGDGASVRRILRHQVDPALRAEPSLYPRT